MQHIDFNGVPVFPSKIVCIGRNYVEHARELNNEVPKEPVIFIKPNSAIAEGIYFNETDTIHYEGEICFLVQSGAIAGVGFGLDLTKREVQTRLKEKGLPWERAKAFDHSAVLSLFVCCPENPKNLRIELYINDKKVQSGSQEQMIFQPQILLDEIKSFLTLEDNDIIMTGTPAGVGPIRRGDHFCGKIYMEDKLLVEGHWQVDRSC